MLSKTVYIVDALRTPVGNLYGSLKDFEASSLAAPLIRELIKRNKIPKNLVSQVILGNAVSAGIGQNFSRKASLSAGLSKQTPAFTVNNICGSGLQSVIVGAQAIKAGDAHIVIAGGAESATHYPYLLNRSDFDEDKKENLRDSLVSDGLECQITGRRMGQLADEIASKNKISRKAQDAYSLESHLKACLAQEKQKFINEIVALTNSSKKIINEDERPRQNLSIEQFRGLPPAFGKEGTVTAGNCSPPADGAALLVLASPDIVKQRNLKPKAKILAYLKIADNPENTFALDAVVIRQCLKRCELTVEDIDLFEISEAFASQVLLAKKKCGIPKEKVNIFGGDIAFGHAFGAAGARSLVSLVYNLIDQGKKRGLASVSVGGGEAIAIIVETC